MREKNDAKEFRESKRTRFRVYMIIKNDFFLTTVEIKKNYNELIN